MPLINITDGLDHLRQAYDIEVLPVEPADDDSAGTGEQSRLMVAVKKRGFRDERLNPADAICGDAVWAGAADVAADTH